MKVTKVETIAVKHYLFVKVYTDENIVGLGEAGNWGFLGATEAAIKKLATFIIGEDPFKIEHSYQNMYRAMYFRGSVLMSAISAIDIALWDIKGKALGVPVYELLGGMTRDKVRTYASGMNPVRENAEEVAESFRKLKAAGFSAGKIFLADPETSVDGKDEFYCNKISRLVNKVKLAREAVGEDFDIILEVHRSMSVPEAIAFADAVTPYRPMFLEDPIMPDNPDAMGFVADKIRIPVATGERFICLHEFETLLARNGAQYVRPDVCAVGGISVTKKVAAVAEAHNALVVPHNPLGPVSSAACIQICASIPNVGIMELPGFMLNGAENTMVKEPLTVENGCFMVPNTPGIGIELAENAEELFPAKDRASNRAHYSFDGSVRDF
ncbi:MAG: mandelate racemase/muconate lactonizing enzyme family protein [Lachnospiraceae bacterium]|nr:mandelate racemase/muconate lactonizing enzyme family protein [Lachnospiraceae bacterium]